MVVVGLVLVRLFLGLFGLLGGADDHRLQQTVIGLGDAGRGVVVEGVQRGDPQTVGLGEVGVDVGHQHGGFLLVAFLFGLFALGFLVVPLAGFLVLRPGAALVVIRVTGDAAASQVPGRRIAVFYKAAQRVGGVVIAEHLFGGGPHNGLLILEEAAIPTGVTGGRLLHQVAVVVVHALVVALVLHDLGRTLGVVDVVVLVADHVVVLGVAGVYAAGVPVGTGIAAGGEVVGLDLLRATLIDLVFVLFPAGLRLQVAAGRVVGLLQVLVAVSVALGHRAEPGLVVAQGQLVGVGQLPVGLHSVLDAAHRPGVGEDQRLDRGPDVVLGQMPAILELVDAGRADQELAELAAHAVDGGFQFAGGGLRRQTRLGLRGLVGFEHPKIGHSPCLLPVDGEVTYTFERAGRYLTGGY